MSEQSGCLTGRSITISMSDAAVEKEDQAKKRWRAENYTRLTADIPKEMMQQISDAAASRRISKRQFIIEALENELER